MCAVCGLSLIFGLASIASAVLDLVIRDRVGTQGRQTQTARGPRPTRGVAVGANTARTCTRSAGAVRVRKSA